MRQILIVVALVVAVGCSNKVPPNTSPEGTAAIRGTQLMAGLRATIPSIKQIVCQATVPQPCIQPAEADRVFAALGKAGEAGEQLAVVLKAVDDAKTSADQKSGLAKAQALLTSIQASIQQAIIAPSAEDVRQKVVGILSTVTTLLSAVLALS